MILLDLLFPNRCVHCDYIIANDNVICDICFAHLNFTHFSFNENNILKQRCSTLFPIENAFALFRFEKNSVTREVIHQLKYKGREKIAKKLAEWTFEKVELPYSKPEIILTVPLHPKKQKQRGYNQMQLYADLLSDHWDIPYEKDALIRKDFQKAQALKKKTERIASKNQFQLVKEIKNKHILLMDDVFTTGNTLSKIAWELIPHNNTISILVLALDQ